ncbi:beta-galactosidase [Sporolactobacillus sp. CPB3-1]|uniref:beta-galactosidase n=1 Tax=Sporolactobacillus mangiferae TaxID=2940498 RepID=A0ABT0MD40_9BACL|nr:beta-galactosidase [Sporolactobacillus mangiferae]MCL1632790.1 beta-galactosidase [Sporolactobacillus mangiferae]
MQKKFWGSLVLVAGLLCANLLGTPTSVKADSVSKTTNKSAVVSFDHYSLKINGERKFIYSGEFEYWRLPSPSLWKDVLQKMKANGFNAVTIYFNWGYHSPKKGVYDFSGIRDVNRLLDMAKEAGLYVIARPGPYVNAETDAGGFPNWLTKEEGKVRNSDPAYTAAYEEWLSHIDPIIKKHLITKGGNVILYQVENEYGSGDADYMQNIIDKVKADGIDVPTFHNQQDGPGSQWASGTGAPDMYAFDSYTKTLGNLKTNFGDAHKYAPNSPIFVAELGNGWFDPWGGVGYDAMRQKFNADYQNVVYKNIIGEGATLLSYYMTYGGTSWGYLPFPGVYTSYDYGAAISENRTIDAKTAGQKRIAYMLDAVKPIYETDSLSEGPMADNASIRLAKLQNPKTQTQFYILRHEQADSTNNDEVSLNINSADVNKTVPVTLNGQAGKILIANYKFGHQKLVYSTAEMMTNYSNRGKDVAVFYSQKGDKNETVLKFDRKPQVNVRSGKVDYQWNEKEGYLTLSNQYQGLAQVDIRSGRQNLMLLLGTDDEAGQLWQQKTHAGTILESGSYLVRSASVKGRTLALTGDTDKRTTLKVYAPDFVKTVTWNGERVRARTVNGSLEVDLAGPDTRKVSLPKLTTWRYQEASPETELNFDDSQWTIADHTTTNSNTKPTTLPVLYSDDYGFHHGNVWFRGHFNGSGNETGIKLYGSSGSHGAYSVWLNGKFLGSADGRKTFTFPEDAVKKDQDNVVSVMVTNMGHEENWGITPTFKNARGLREASLQGTDVSNETIQWRIQGNQGGEDLKDTARGAYNYGGLYGERNGWTLPGYRDSAWRKVSLPNNQGEAGVGWYRNSFDLNIPKNYDVPIALKITDDPSYNYRAYIYVNGWLYGQYINNLGPQHEFYLPSGLLNEHGKNNISIAVWGLDDQGARLGNVELVQDGIYKSSLNVQQVKAPDYQDLFSKGHHHTKSGVHQ